MVLLPSTVIHCMVLLTSTVIHCMVLLTSTVIYCMVLLTSTVIYSMVLLTSTVIHSTVLLTSTVPHCYVFVVFIRKFYQISAYLILSNAYNIKDQVKKYIFKQEQFLFVELESWILMPLFWKVLLLYENESAVLKFKSTPFLSHMGGVVVWKHLVRTKWHIIDFILLDVKEKSLSSFLSY